MAKILIVDDEITNQEVAAVICEAAGHEVAVASNGREAIDLLQGGAFDLVLMDFLMPVLNGADATRELRAQSAFADLPIVGLTAKASKADVRSLIDIGMTAVLTKPFRNKQLLEAVNDALGQ